MKSFAELFKKYRLRAQFANLYEMVDALAEKGYISESSIISHWQRGKRTPRKRSTIILVIALFIEKNAITSLDEANEFLESAGHGYLTKSEQTDLLSR